MSTLSQTLVSVTVDLGGTIYTLPASQIDLTMDAERTPYITGLVTCPLGRLTLTNIDPTNTVIWFDISVRRVLGRIDRIRDLTRRYRRRLVSAITEQFAGERISAITDSLYHDYDQPGSTLREDGRTFHIVMRSIEIDQAAGQVTFEFASGESLLSDHHNAQTLPVRIQGATLTDKVNTIIQAVPETFAPGLSYPPAETVPTDQQIGDEAIWEVGEPIWEVAQSLTRQWGLQLWCDDAGKWALKTGRDTTVAARTLTSSGPDRTIINLVTKRSRDDGWHNAVGVEYATATGSTWDIATLVAYGIHRMRVLTLNRANPGPGRARHVLTNIAKRGRATEVLAVADYTSRPGDSVIIDTPREHLRGRISAIRWQLPDDVMSIRLRDVEDI